LDLVTYHFVDRHAPQNSTVGKPRNGILESPMKHLILASGSSRTVGEERVLQLARWMGAPTKTIALDAESALTLEVLAKVDGQHDCLAMSADTLALAHRASPRCLEKVVQEHHTEMLIFGWSDPTRHGQVLSWLTGGAIRGVSAPAGGQNVLDLPFGGRDFSRQLAGLSFSSEGNRSVPTFEAAFDGAATGAVVLANRQPVFLRLAPASGEIFLLAGSEVPDVDEALSPGNGIEAYYDQLIPFLIFLRHSFGEKCWHGPPSTARIIIDDPLLTERYGFLDYRALLSSMQRARYGTSIAFIPWNYRRTSSRTASSLFQQRPDLSICVHGCDHTNKEFAIADRALLEWKAGLALERMERHQTRTGLPFERVMVFPQGRFSSDAMLALRTADYLAAVNSTCFPTDETGGRLRIGDFLRPAITRFHGFPIFHRWYPRRLVDCAFDMFLGKPALLVEHAQDFRDGCGHLEEFVIGLRKLEPTVAWPTLSSQLMRSCIMRSVSPDTVEVQFFTKRFHVENVDEERRRFRLTKYEPDASVVRAVLVDGVSVPFGANHSSVEVELEADPGQARDIEIVDQPRPPRRRQRMGLMYSIGVLGRRSLSEFRDNSLARHPRLLGAATRVARRLKVTGDRHGR